SRRNNRRIQRKVVGFLKKISSSGESRRVHVDHRQVHGRNRRIQDKVVKFREKSSSAAQSRQVRLMWLPGEKAAGQEAKSPPWVRRGSAKRRGVSSKKTNPLTSTTPALRATPPQLRRGLNPKAAASTPAPAGSAFDDFSWNSTIFPRIRQLSPELDD